MKRISGGRGMLAILLAATAGMAGVAGGAIAQNGAALQTMHGSHGSPTMSPADMDAHLDTMIATMIPDATPEQKRGLKAAATSTHADLQQVHSQLGQAHRRLHALLLAPRIDRAAIETLRVNQLGQLDATTRHMFKSVADAAELLTPEQRARVIEQLKNRPH